MGPKYSCIAVALSAVCLGCFGSQAETADLDGIVDPTSPDECVVNNDCVPAGSSCCDTPTHAVPRSSGWQAACEDVQCEQPETTQEAVCNSGTCVLQCAPVQCSINCANGFGTDAYGCLTCPASAVECPGAAPPAKSECEADDDCVRIAADCCGCANGGTDTAVAADQVDLYLGGLGCESSPACPGVDVCQADLTPRCLNNACVLLSIPSKDLSPDAGVGGVGGLAYCGSADLPPCPDGQVCVLNIPGAEDANMNGLGVCQDP